MSTSPAVQFVTLTVTELESMLDQAAARGARTALHEFTTRPAPQRPLVDIAEAAKAMNISEVTIRRRLKAGRITAACQNPLRFDVEELRKQLRSS
ncbi:MAG: helix-turn-helix domain-containing protein [Pirellulales bacterium]